MRKLSNEQIEPSDQLPLVTFAIISYNQEKYIRDAIEGAFAQDYSPLQIIISDDFSTDRTYQIIEELADNYSGQHSLILNRNPQNLGLAANVNKVWELAFGELLVLQGGDDISVPHRTSVIVDEWLTKKTPDLVFSSVILIDEDGQKIGERTDVKVPGNALKDSIIGKREYVTGGCCSAYTKSLHWTAGPLPDETIAEDFIYTFRALLGGGIVGIEEPLVLYRQHDASIMGEGRNKKRDKKRNLVGRRSRLLEYKKAMETYHFNNAYLVWRLNRRIKTYDIAVRALGVGLLGKILLAAQALVTFRLGLFIDALKYAFK